MRRKEEKRMTLAEREEKIMQAEEKIRAHGNKEALALFRIMRETGIRMNDLLALAPENICGRELRVIESKFGGNRWYRFADGRYPVISDETWELLQLGEDGKYFHHTRDYFVRLFRKVIGDKRFMCHELRRLAIDSGKIKIE